MSHETGKIEIIAYMKDQLVLKYQRFVRDKDKGKVFSIDYPDNVYWLARGLEPLRFDDAHLEPGRSVGEYALAHVSGC